MLGSSPLFPGQFLPTPIVRSPGTARRVPLPRGAAAFRGGGDRRARDADGVGKIAQTLDLHPSKPSRCGVVTALGFGVAASPPQTQPFPSGWLYFPLSRQPTVTGRP